jgi:hypothetical protein
MKSTISDEKLTNKIGVYHKKKWFESNQAKKRLFLSFLTF